MNNDIDALMRAMSGEPDEQAAGDGGTLEPNADPVAAMQQLLMSHEREGLHTVEDPALVRVLDELKWIGHSNIADFYEHLSVSVIEGVDDAGEPVFNSFDRLSLVDITRLPRHISACIKKVKVTKKMSGDTVEVELYDKPAALEKLMKYHGAYERDNAQIAQGMSSTLDLLFSSIGGGGLPELKDNAA